MLLARKKRPQGKHIFWVTVAVVKHFTVYHVTGPKS